MLEQANCNYINKYEYWKIVIATFIVLYATTSYICTNYLQERYKVILYCISIMFVLFNAKPNKNFVKPFLFTLILSFLGMISSIIAGDNFTHIISPFINIVLACVFVYCVDYKYFIRALSDVITFTSIISVIAYILYFIAPSIIESFPKRIIYTGSMSYDLFFTVLRPASYMRVQGFCWEAGVFQTFLNIVLCYEVLQNHLKIKRIILLYITLILTFSTTGYIAGIISIMLLVTRRSNLEYSKIFRLIAFCICFIMFIIIIYPYVPKTINGTTFGFEKIERFFKAGSLGYTDSSGTRFNALVVPFEIFLNNPLFGVGYIGTENVMSALGDTYLRTCTFTNYMATYGFLYSLIFFVCIFSLGKTVTKSPIEKILLFVMFMLVIFSEHYMNYYFLDIFIIYGAQQLNLMQKNSTIKTEVLANEGI